MRLSVLLGTAGLCAALAGCGVASRPSLAGATASSTSSVSLQSGGWREHLAITATGLAVTVTAPSHTTILPYCGGPPISIHYLSPTGQEASVSARPVPQYCGTTATSQATFTFTTPGAPGTYAVRVIAGVSGTGPVELPMTAHLVVSAAGIQLQS